MSQIYSALGRIRHFSMGAVALAALAFGGCTDDPSRTAVPGPSSTSGSFVGTAGGAVSTTGTGAGTTSVPMATTSSTSTTGAPATTGGGTTSVVGTTAGVVGDNGGATGAAVDGAVVPDASAGSDAGADSSTADSGMPDTSGRPCHSSDDWTPKGDDLWISPTGSDANPGTEASPKQSLTAAIATWSAGKTIWVMPGTYAHSSPISLSTQATADGPLRISGVTGSDKPVIDFSGQRRATGNNGERGIQLSGSYVHLRYLEIKQAADNCIHVSGAHNTLEWLVVHECQDTGVQLSNGAADNRVLNVDSYLNADPSGENADGFAPKLSIGQGNYFCGTRAYHNADDGYDCWASGDGSPVTFEYCWAFGQPGPTATANGDGNGFKLGSPSRLASGGNAPHELIDCFAFHNRSVGFTSNGNSSGEITCSGCGAWDNGAAWSGGSGGREPVHTGDVTDLDLSIEEAIAAPRDANGNLPDIRLL